MRPSPRPFFSTAMATMALLSVSRPRVQPSPCHHPWGGAPLPLRNGGRRTPEASANDGYTPGRPRRHGSVRPLPETCAGNPVQRGDVEWCPPDKRTRSLRGSEGDTHFDRNAGNRAQHTETTTHVPFALL